MLDTCCALIEMMKTLVLLSTMLVAVMGDLAEMGIDEDHPKVKLFRSLVEPVMEQCLKKIAGPYDLEVKAASYNLEQLDGPAGREQACLLSCMLGVMQNDDGTLKPEEVDSAIQQATEKFPNIDLKAGAQECIQNAVLPDAAGVKPDKCEVAMRLYICAISKVTEDVVAKWGIGFAV